MLCRTRATNLSTASLTRGRCGEGEASGCHYRLSDPRRPPTGSAGWFMRMRPAIHILARLPQTGPMLRVPLAFVLALVLIAGPATQSGSVRVILVTLDGARAEELFGGLDADVFTSTLREKQKRTISRPTIGSGPTRRPRDARNCCRSSGARSCASTGRLPATQRLEAWSRSPTTLLLLSGLLGDPSWRSSRRHYQEQRSAPESIPDGARGGPVGSQAI